MTPKHRLPALLLVLLGVASLVQAGATTPQPTTVPVIELRGTPAQLGKSHGELLGRQILLLYEQYLQPFFRKPMTHVMANGAAAAFRTRLLPDQDEEIQALATSAHIDASAAMLAQCFPDLLPMFGCSTITLPASAASDHVPRFARNLDFPSMDIADKHTVVLIFHPHGKYAFASVTWPGMVGVLSGMNEHGLVLANMEVPRGLRPPVAMPYALLYRMLLERCKTVDEAVVLLNSTPRQSANNLMLMDANGLRAVVEITPEQIVVRRGLADQALISTNHQRGQDQYKPGRCWRYDTLRKVSTEEFGQIGLRETEALLDKVAQGDGTMQSMIFEPTTRILYLACGLHASRRNFTRIDLNPYFQSVPEPTKSK